VEPQAGGNPDSASHRREDWLASLRPDGQAFRLFDHVDDVLFFAKDRDGRLLAANRALLDHYGYRDENEFWGVTDFDLLPHSLAVKFRRDDLLVMETGRPLVDLVEIFVNRQGIPGWFVTTKLPVHDVSGRVVGVMGVIQAHAKSRAALPDDQDLARALEHLRAHFTEEVPVGRLAALAGLSVRQFERRFRHHLKTTPQEFLIKMRVSHACGLLRESNQPLGEIALDCGFYDQSALTRHFRKHMGMTPLRYRRAYR
jgi:AraC-like DNA-binding protein